VRNESLIKCDRIIAGFPVLKAMAIFGAGKIVRHLKAEIKGLSENELAEMREYLRMNLSPNDYGLFNKYLGRALK